jgi:MFS family permease
MKRSVVRVGGLLFLSGLCALVLQVTWFREFRLVFGASTAASAAVLAIFMGGLGLGNAVLGRRADRHPNPLAYYARLELGVACMAAASPLLIDLARRAYMALGGQSALGFSGATIVRLLLSTLVLGGATFLMGGTLPAAARAVTAADDENRRDTAFLYALNTLGAVLGALLSTFFAIELLGTRATLWTACALNASVAGAAFALARQPGGARQSPPEQPEQPGAAQAMNPAGKRRPTALLLAVRPPAGVVYTAAGIVGFAFFHMELVWYRMLGPLLGGSTYTFGLILAVALLGVALGAIAYALLLGGRRATLRGLALCCSLEALAIAAPFALGDQVALWAAWLQQLNHGSFALEVAGWAAIAAAVILPAAVVSGWQFPLLVALLGRGDEDLGREIGLAVAWNTVGAILGSLAGGFGLLPLVSAPGAWRAVALLVALLGAATLAMSLWKEGRRLGAVLPLAGLAAAVICSVQPGPTAVWRHSGIGVGRAEVPAAGTNALRNWENSAKRRIVWQSDGVESSVAIARHHGLAFIVNGKSDGAAIGDAGTQIMLGLVAAILHPHPQTAFVVGLGTGETAGWLAEVPSMSRVDVVELEPAIDEVARCCRELNFDVLRHPKVSRVYNDAREVLLTTPRRYDLIVSEPSNPYRSGIASLFTREFYRAGRERLNDGGLFVQWLQGYEIDEQTVRTVCATLRAVFPHVEIWQSSHLDLLLLGAMQPIEYPEAELRRRIAGEPFRSALAHAWRAADLEGLLARYIGGPALLEDLVGPGPARQNTDDRTEIEYGFARTLGHHHGFSALDLRHRAIAIGDQRPPVRGPGVDWLAVQDQWRAMYAALERTVAADASLAPDQRARWKALERIVVHDWRGAVEAWQSQPRFPSCPTELALLAQAYAQLGDDRALPLVERLQSLEPTEAGAILGILLWRQGQPEASAKALGVAFRRLRIDPWPLEDVISNALNTAVFLAYANPRLALRLLEAIQQPAAADYAYELRGRMACLIGKMLQPAAALPALESFEPYVPWNEPFLKLRRQVYHATGHPLSAQAERDWEEFARMADQPY